MIVPRRKFSRAERLKILIENANLFSQAAICEKWGISRGVVRSWKRELAYNPWIGGERAWVIAALYNGPPNRGADLASIANYLDWKNHCRYTDVEILAILRGLRKEGIAVERSGLWYYNRARLRRRPAFIF